MLKAALIDTVIFDMDGTLIDCADWHRRALDAALEPYGYRITDAMHESVLNGLPTMKKLELLGVPQALRQTINENKQRLFMKTARERCHPVAKNVEALRQLHEAGYTLAVASNSIRPTVDLLLDLAGYLPFLTLTLSNTDVTQPKPSPEIYQTAIRRLGTVCERTLIVEDNFNGIQAARASGAHVLTVSSPADITAENLNQALVHASQQVCLRRTGGFFSEARTG